MSFIVPAQPTLHSSPPRGIGWLHEVKFDGLRIQLHKQDRGVAIYTKSGHDYTRAFPSIAAAIAALPARTCAIDGELTFRAQRFRAMHDDDLCVWAFDLLELNGRDRRGLPLITRKFLLAQLVYKLRQNSLRLSESFDDGVKLFVAAGRMGHEGIVSKQRIAPYRSGRKCEWIKVDCATWHPSMTAGISSSVPSTQTPAIRPRIDQLKAPPSSWYPSFKNTLP